MHCSIIIPTRDRPESLLRSAGSALAALEGAGSAGGVIVVDDGDAFPAAATLASLSGPSLRITVNPGPKGPSAARNHGAALAPAGLLFFLDDDDLMVPDYPRRILAQRRSGACKAVWGFSRVRESRAGRGLPARAAMLGPGTPLRQRLAGAGCGFWIESAVFARLGGLDERLTVNEDTDFCLTLAAAGLMPWHDPRAGVRLDAARGEEDRPSTTRIARAAGRAANWEYILEKHARLLASHPQERGIFAARVAKYRARAGDVRGALALAVRQTGSGRWRALAQALAGALSRRG